MATRLLAILTGIWWTLWTVVIVPIHTRGAIPLAAGTCPMCASCCEKPAPDSHSQPTKDPSENCAVCHTVAILSTTPHPHLFTLTFLCVGYLNTPTIAHPVLNAAPDDLLCRGPPTA